MQNEPLEEYKPKLELKDLKQEFPKSLTKICCPSCDQEVPSQNLNINDKIAKCDHCDGIFDFQEAAASLIDSNTTTEEIARPEGIESAHFGSELDISIKQPLTPIEGLGIMILPAASMLSTIIYFAKGKGELWIVLSILLLTVWVLTSLIFRSKHRVHINVDEDFLHIKYRPKKLIKDKKYDSTEIDQLYVKDTPNMGGVGLFMIVNAPEGQKHLQLIGGLDTLSKAKYMEQEIEKHLGLPNRVVPDEKK